MVIGRTQASKTKIESGHWLRGQTRLPSVQYRLAKIGGFVVDAAILNPDSEMRSKQRLVDACAEVEGWLTLPRDILPSVERRGKDQRTDAGESKWMEDDAGHRDQIGSGELVGVVLDREALVRVNLGEARVVVAAFKPQPPVIAMAECGLSANAVGGFQLDAVAIHSGTELAKRAHRDIAVVKKVLRGRGDGKHHAERD